MMRDSLQASSNKRDARALAPDSWIANRFSCNLECVWSACVLVLHLSARADLYRPADVTGDSHVSHIRLGHVRWRDRSGMSVIEILNGEGVQLGEMIGISLLNGEQDWNMARGLV